MRYLLLALHLWCVAAVNVAERKSGFLKHRAFTSHGRKMVARVAGFIFSPEDLAPLTGLVGIKEAIEFVPPNTDTAIVEPTTTTVESSQKQISGIIDQSQEIAISKATDQDPKQIVVVSDSVVSESEAEHVKSNGPETPKTTKTKEESKDDNVQTSGNLGIVGAGPAGLATAFWAIKVSKLSPSKIFIFEKENTLHHNHLVTLHKDSTTSSTTYQSSSLWTVIEEAGKIFQNKWKDFEWKDVGIYRDSHEVYTAPLHRFQRVIVVALLMLQVPPENFIVGVHVDHFDRTSGKLIYHDPPTGTTSGPTKAISPAQDNSIPSAIVIESDSEAIESDSAAIESDSVIPEPIPIPITDQKSPVETDTTLKPSVQIFGLVVNAAGTAFSHSNPFLKPPGTVGISDTVYHKHPISTTTVAVDGKPVPEELDIPVIGIGFIFTRTGCEQWIQLIQLGAMHADWSKTGVYLDGKISVDIKDVTKMCHVEFENIPTGFYWPLHVLRHIIHEEKVEDRGAKTAELLKKVDFLGAVFSKAKDERTEQQQQGIDNLIESLYDSANLISARLYVKQARVVAKDVSTVTVTNKDGLLLSLKDSRGSSTSFQMVPYDSRVALVGDSLRDADFVSSKGAADAGFLAWVFAKSIQGTPSGTLKQPDDYMRDTTAGSPDRQHEETLLTQVAALMRDQVNLISNSTFLVPGETIQGMNFRPYQMSWSSSK